MTAPEEGFPVIGLPNADLGNPVHAVVETPEGSAVSEGEIAQVPRSPLVTARTTEDDGDRAQSAA